MFAKSLTIAALSAAVDVCPISLRRLLRVATTSTVLAAGLVTANGVVNPAPAAASHAGAVCSAFGELPYYHTDFWGRRYIYAHANSRCRSIAYCCWNNTPKASLMQHYGGRWNYVGYGSTEQTGQPHGTYNRTDKPASVRCYKPYTAYYFATSGHGTYSLSNNFYAYYTSGANVSGVKLMYC